MLAVTGIGMVSALGLDVVTSCAAARAGIRRAGDLDDVHVFDEEAGGLVPVVAHRVPLVSKGLYGFARLLQLSVSAISDLRQTAGTTGTRPIGLVLALRSERHRQKWLERVRMDPDASPDDIDLPAAERELVGHRRHLGESLLGTLVDRAGLSVEPRAQRTILGDQTGFVAALQQASVWLASGVCETCWVGGVDSYLDPPTIQALMGFQLLRTPTNPVGFIPGEAACFLALERAGRQQGKVCAVIDSFAETEGAADRLGAARPDPGPLMQVIAQADAGRGVDLPVVNLNGDTVRASEWGMVLGRPTLRKLADRPAWIPPLYFGEIGAATAPTSVALLARAWARGYAPAHRALICLMEDGTARGAVSVTAP